MKSYPIDKIRNVALVGHGGTGKTSLAESMLFASGSIARMGKVDDGSSAGDFDPDEIHRKMSLSATVLPCEWKGTKINLIDTPGYPDFIGDVISSLRAVEAAVLVVDGHGHIEVGTDSAWELTEELGVTRLFFVNKLEKENTDFYSTLEALRDRFGSSVAALQIPIGSEDKFCGVVDLVTQKAYRWDSGKVSLTDIPEDMADDISVRREMLVESCAEMDDDLMEKFFADGTLNDVDLEKALEIGIRTGRVVPVLCGAAMKMIGVETLLDIISLSVPSPAEIGLIKGKNKDGADETRKPGDSFCALVFKTMADPYVGKLTYFRVFSGAIKSDSHVFNGNREHDERIGQVYFLTGKTQEATAAVGAGDIGAVAKLQNTMTGDTLCEKAKLITLEPIKFPAPVYSLSVRAKTKADEDKLGPGLQKLAEEDPTFRSERNSETSESLMSGMGETHVDIVVERLKRKFGVEVDIHLPKIAYRETITKTAESQGRHKKQTGGRGQFGDCWVRVEPQPRGAGYEFVDAIVGGSIPRQWIPSVDKGIREALSNGALTGCTVVDVKATCYDGSFHTVDSSDMAFQLAGKIGFRLACEKAGPVLLEPVMEMEVIVPEEYMGDVIGDLNGKRGKVAGMEPVGGGRQCIKATAPQSEVQRYCIDLRSMARGRGKFSSKFSHYEEAPAHVAQQVAAETKKVEEE